MVRELRGGGEVHFDGAIKKLPESAVRPIELADKGLDYADILTDFGGRNAVFQDLSSREEQNYLERARSVEATEQLMVKLLEEAYSSADVLLTIPTREKLENAVLQKGQLETLRKLSEHELRRYAEKLTAIWGQKQKIWERAEKVGKNEEEIRLAAK